MTAESRICELGIQLPSIASPQGLYRPIVVSRGMAFASGHGPIGDDGLLVRGRAGEDFDIEQAAALARRVAISMLAGLRVELGSLDRVTRVVKTLGLVQCISDFQGHPAVINGFSQLMADVFGSQRGIGARSAFGAHALPGGMLLEIECIFEVDEFLPQVIPSD